jgi:hypothetical protein
MAAVRRRQPQYPVRLDQDKAFRHEMIHQGEPLVAVPSAVYECGTGLDTRVMLRVEHSGHSAQQGVRHGVGDVSLVRALQDGRKAEQQG